MTNATEIPKKSIIVVAHPDDEVLWLSSILPHVEKIIICFSDCPGAPHLGPGRRNALTAYPLDNTVLLDIKESASFNAADWRCPVESEQGLFIKNPEIARRYQESYEALYKELSPLLNDVDDVFTHNPWGEYGHEDHVQVYRVIKSLKKLKGYNLWFSNYGGNRSHNLMLKYVNGYSSDYVTFNTNIDLAKRISAIYMRYGCWTWYKDYEWFKNESFMKDRERSSVLAYGHAFPINFVRTDFAVDPIDEPPDFIQRVKRLFKKFGLKSS